MKFVAGNAQHIGARPQQQDSFGFSDPSDPKFVAHAGFLGVVADGMGGLTHGSEASRSAVLAFLSAYKSKSAGEPIPKALARCLSEANTAVLRVAENVPAGEEVGTTLVAAVLHDHALHWVSVGDSRIYLLRGVTLTRLTADHVYARELNRQASEGNISLREAQDHPERAALTSYLGQRELAHVDKNVRPLKVQREDCVMLCSDGFYRALSPEEIVTGFRTTPQKACATLLRQGLAKRRKQQDNLTVIALRRRARGPMPASLKLALAASAILLAALSEDIGYSVGKRFAVPDAPALRTSPPPPPPTLGRYTPSGDESHGTNGGAGPKPINPPKSETGKNVPKSAKTGSKQNNPRSKNAAAGGDKSAKTPSQAPKSTGKNPQNGQAKSTQGQSPGRQEKGSTSSNSGSAAGASEQQNKTNPTETPGAAPTTPTSTTAPPTPSKDDQKKGSAPPPKKEDQPSNPTPPQKNDQENPSNPPPDVWRRR